MRIPQLKAVNMPRVQPCDWTLTHNSVPWSLLLLLVCALRAGCQAPTPRDLSRPSDLAECADLGYKSLQKYRQAVPIFDQRRASTPLLGFLPVYSSAPLLPVPSSAQRRITTAIIYVHGAGARANAAFCHSAHAADAVAGEDASRVLTIAPWFGSEQVLARDWQAANLDIPETTGSLYWRFGWTSGDAGAVTLSWEQSTLPQLTSFGALDAILSVLLDNARFPNLSLITVTGFSAGGQLVQRFAWASSLPPGPVNDVRIRFMPVSPSSYLYLSPARPDPACTPLLDTGRNWSCAEYVKPQRRVSGYNDWKYGLDRLSASGPYLSGLSAQAIANRTAVYGQRQILYVLGGHDVCNCQAPDYSFAKSVCNREVTCTPSLYFSCCDTYPDAGTTNLLDVSPSAMLQGSNRLQRGLLFAKSLTLVFNSSFRPRVSVISKMHHEEGEYLSSDTFGTYAFQRSKWPPS